MADISTALRILANGVNPDTGEKLPHFVSVNKVTKAAYLLKLANEIESIEMEKLKREENTKAKSERFKSLVWSNEKIEKLAHDFNAGIAIPDIAIESGRTEAAIAYRLIVAEIASQEHVLSLLGDTVKERTLEIIKENRRRKKKKES